MGSRFVRRENRPSDEAILSGRLIDRTIRPLFDSRLRREVQVVVTVLAYDERHDPDVIGLLATSAALAISDIPWAGPVAGVQYTSAENENPSYKAFFAGPEDRINMIEFEGKEIADSFAISVFEKAQKDIQALVAFQKKIVAEIGKKKADVALPTPDAALIQKVRDHISVAPNAAEEEVKKAVMELPKIKESLEDKQMRKFIYVPGRLVNIVVTD
jgi:polyribonucleotide nucleotidyltransferase